MDQIIPQRDLDEDNVGLPVSGVNMADSNSGTIRPEDADIRVTLKPSHRPTRDYVHALVNDLPQLLPVASFAFLPADIITPILNIRASVDVQVIGSNQAANRAYAEMLLTAIRNSGCIVGQVAAPKTNISTAAPPPLAAVPRLSLP